MKHTHLALNHSTCERPRKRLAPFVASVSLRNQPVPLAENLALGFVCLGNVLGHWYESTYCPGCWVEL